LQPSCVILQQLGLLHIVPSSHICHYLPVRASTDGRLICAGECTAAQATSDRDSRALRSFFRTRGFPCRAKLFCCPRSCLRLWALPPLKQARTPPPTSRRT